MSGGFDPISGAVSLGTSLLNGVLTANQNQTNQANSMQMMEMQNQLNIDNWNRQNEYNSPAQQMGRYKAAGLNPNLIYGQMSNSPTIASPSASVPQQQTAHIENPMGSIQAGAQTKLIEAETFKTTQEGLSAKAQADVATTQNQLLMRNLGLQGDSLQSAITNTGSQTDLNLQKLNQNNSLFPSQLDASILANDKTRAETSKIIQDKLNSLTITDLAKLAQQNDNVKTQLLVNKNPAEISSLLASGEASRQTAKNTNLNSDLKREDLRRAANNEPMLNETPWNFGGRVIGGALNAVTSPPAMMITEMIKNAAKYKSSHPKNHD